MVKNANLPQNEKWLKNIPCNTRQLILKDLSTACKSALTNKINGHINSFKFKHKSKKKIIHKFFILIIDQ